LPPPGRPDLVERQPELVAHHLTAAGDIERTQRPPSPRRAPSEFAFAPKRAGGAIWGSERELPKFSLSNNCKDPLYR